MIVQQCYFAEGILQLYIFLALLFFLLFQLCEYFIDFCAGLRETLNARCSGKRLPFNVRHHVLGRRWGQEALIEISHILLGARLSHRFLLHCIFQNSFLVCVLCELVLKFFIFLATLSTAFSLAGIKDLSIDIEIISKKIHQ